MKTKSTFVYGVSNIQHMNVNSVAYRIVIDYNIKTLDSTQTFAFDAMNNAIVCPVFVYGPES